MRDYRKSLVQLEAEWQTCIKCNLADRRINNRTPLVFGEGTPQGILFVGEGPGKDEEKLGRPFVGASGYLLRRALHKLGLTDVYMTNTVACRSCAPAYTGEGQPITRKNRQTGEQEPLIRDQPPTQQQQAACAPRLHEQVYLVDPILIVALGGEAVRALTGKPTTITSVRGSLLEVSIEGHWCKPSLTEKKRVWARKVRGQVHMPVVPNLVRYSLLPVFHPAYVVRNLSDHRPGNPVENFMGDLKLAASIYDQYMLEVYGVMPGERDLSEDDIRGIGDEHG